MYYKIQILDFKVLKVKFNNFKVLIIINKSIDNQIDIAILYSNPLMGGGEPVQFEYEIDRLKRTF